MDLKFSIITPTYNRSVDVVKRCIESVNGQSYDNWEHIIISDCDYDEPEIKYLCLNMPNATKRIYTNTGVVNSNTWGAYPRQYGIEKHSNGDYCIFLDDDNILLSHALRMAYENIDDKTKSVIWSIYHNGDLNPNFLPDSIPVNINPNISYILTGNPPRKYIIDTLNAVLKTDVIKTIGWVCNVGNLGYCNDGDTYDKIFQSGFIKDDEIKFISEVLGIHV